MLGKLADLLEAQVDEFAALEALNVGMLACFSITKMFFIDIILIGKMWATAKYFDITDAVSCFRYYAGWADKVHGKTIEVGTRIWLLKDNLLTVRDRPMRINWLTRGMNHMALWYVSYHSVLYGC